jgi:hypothetical protein
METRTVSPRPDVSVATTSPRVTPTPPRASRFGEVLSSTVVRGAESAMRMLPGSPVMAVAVRGATGSAASVNMPMSTMSNGASSSPIGATTAGPMSTTRSPEGPLTTTTGGAPRMIPGTGLPAVTGSGVPGAGIPGAGVAPQEGAGIEASLQHSQDMNLYFLQIQEQVNAQNRSFTTLSNVLKAEHDTVKTAIGNIR